MAYFTPARAAGWLATSSIAALMISSALAQTQPAPQRPATPAPQRPAAGAPARPAQPAPQAQQAPQPGQGQQGEPQAAPLPQLIYSQWLKFCVLPDGSPADPKDASAKGKQLCYTGIEGRLESGASIVTMVAFDPPADAEKVLRITLPVGLQLQFGSRIVIDDGEPLRAPFVTCMANGCIADYKLSPDILGKVKKGKSAKAQAILVNGTYLDVPVPLVEFAKAYDGAPADPKILEQQQKKLEDELKKKGEELKKKAEENQKKLEQKPQ